MTQNHTHYIVFKRSRFFIFTDHFPASPRPRDSCGAGAIDFFFLYSVRRHRLHTFEPPVRRQRGRSLEGAGGGDGPLEAGEKTRLRQHRWRSEQQQFQRPADDGDDVGELRDGADDWRRRKQQQLQPPSQQQHHRHHQQQRRRPEDHRSRRKCKFRILTTACGELARAAAGTPEGAGGGVRGATGAATGGAAGGPACPQSPQPTTADVDCRRRSYYSEECGRGAPDLDIMTEFVSMAAATA